MSAAFDAWLARRAAAGDEAAFGQLLQTYGRKLRGVVQSFAHASDADVDDLAQIVALRMWEEIQRGGFNPGRASFGHYASVCAGQALRDDKQRRRAAKRWAAESPLSLDLARDDGLDPWAAPSWWNGGADPQQIVLERERLRLAWQELSEANQAHLNRWLNADGGNRPGGLSKSEITCAATARARAHRVLAELA